MIRNIFILIFFSSLLVLFSCGNDLVTNPAEIVFPDTNVSFQAHVQPLITLTCSYQGCHSDISQAGGIRLTDYFSYFDNASVLGLVIPGDPDGSRMVQIIENPNFHIPYIVWYLNDNHKTGIRQWIDEDATNN